MDANVTKFWKPFNSISLFCITKTTFWPSLPAYTANLLHHLSTTKNGATYPPINTRQTWQKKLYWLGQILPLLPIFVVVSG